MDLSDRQDKDKFPGQILLDIIEKAGTESGELAKVGGMKYHFDPVFLKQLQRAPISKQWQKRLREVLDNEDEWENFMGWSGSFEDIFNKGAKGYFGDPSEDGVVDLADLRSEAIDTLTGDILSAEVFKDDILGLFDAEQDKIPASEFLARVILPLGGFPRILGMGIQMLVSLNLHNKSDEKQGEATTLLKNDKDLLHEFGLRWREIFDSVRMSKRWLELADNFTYMTGRDEVDPNSKGTMVLTYHADQAISEIARNVISSLRAERLKSIGVRLPGFEDGGVESCKEDSEESLHRMLAESAPEFILEQPENA